MANLSPTSVLSHEDRVKRLRKFSHKYKVPFRAVAKTAGLWAERVSLMLNGKKAMSDRDLDRLEAAMSRAAHRRAHEILKALEEFNAARLEERRAPSSEAAGASAPAVADEGAQTGA